MSLKVIILNERFLMIFGDFIFMIFGDILMAFKQDHQKS